MDTAVLTEDFSIVSCNTYVKLQVVNWGFIRGLGFPLGNLLAFCLANMENGAKYVKCNGTLSTPSAITPKVISVVSNKTRTRANAQIEYSSVA